MAETACLTVYTSPSIAPSKGIQPYPSGSPLGHHATYGNGTINSGYVSNLTPATFSPPSSCNVAHGSAASNCCNGSDVATPPPVPSAAPVPAANPANASNTGGAIAVANGHHYANGKGFNGSYGMSGGQAPFHPSNGHALAHCELPQEVTRPTLWYEEEIDENLRWCFGLISILHTGVSKFQEIALLDTKPFGKVLTLDRKMQSAEKDEWVYHECLVHPALLLHASPKNVFIMGGGEGSTAREALRHRSVRKVVMCDIDEEVVKFCSAHLTMNREAFRSSKLELVINDARAELESREERFDVIVGDLADPMEGGPCYQLYMRGFYETVVKPKLNPGGIFVTQAGPAGILSHKEVFTSIFNTLRQVFAHVVAYAAHVPSYADTWGWVMASDHPFTQLSNDELNCRIKQRIKGELRYLDGATLHASTVLNKTVRESLLKEKHVYTEDTARFVYGHGRSSCAGGALH